MTWRALYAWREHNPIRQLHFYPRVVADAVVALRNLASSETGAVAVTHAGGVHALAPHMQRTAHNQDLIGGTDIRQAGAGAARGGRIIRPPSTSRLRRVCVLTQEHTRV